MNRHSIKFLSAVSLAALLIANADAADYAAGFSINADASHNDNIRFIQDDKTSVKKYGLSPSVTFSINTETTKAQFNSTFDFNRYDKSEFNTNDQHLTLSLSHQLESSSLGLTAKYIHDTTLTSEQLTTGRIGNRADPAKQYTLAPYWVYTFSETNSIQFQGTYTQQKYENTTYLGYKNTGVKFDWFHLITDRVKFTAVATYSDYQSDDVKLEVPAFPVLDFNPNLPRFFFPPGYFGEQKYATQTKSEGAKVGIDYQWSEQSLIKARIGRSQNRTSYPVKDTNQICTNSIYLQVIADVGPIGSACEQQDTSDPQSTAELDWMWSNERQQFNLNATKAIQPTSNGYAVDSTQISSNWSYQLSELNRISASLSAARNQAINNKNPLQNTSIADRDYGSATLQYQRQLSEYWFLNASFKFSKQKYTQIDDQASSKVYSLGISYSPQQWHWAR